MRTAKLIIGILSCVLVLIVMLQSCGASFVTAVDKTDDTSGAVGILFGVLLLAAGITAIAGRDSVGATIAAGALYAIGGIIGITQNGVYGDLQIWAGLSLIFALVFFLSVAQMNKQAKTAAAVASAAPSWVEQAQASAPPQAAPTYSPSPAQSEVSSGGKHYKIVFPRHYEEANKRHGLVIALRVIAILQVLAFTGLTLLWSMSALPALLVRYFNLDLPTAQNMAIPLGVAIGIIGGLATSIGTWALALLLDDIHATRLYLGGFNVYDEGKDD